MIARQESAVLAQTRMETRCQRPAITPQPLTLHADRGAPMTAQSMAQLLDDLGVIKSHSRPRIAHDHPYSEAPFKTLKYRPEFPDRFGSPADARVWGPTFFPWYNQEHYHTGLGLLTPATVHYGKEEPIRAQRQRVLETAFAAHPERFVRGPATPPKLPEAVWINKPKDQGAVTP